MRLWDATTHASIGEPIASRGPAERLARPVFTPDGKRVLAGDGSSARLWSSATGKPAGEILKHAKQVTALAVSPNGRTLLTGCLDGTAQQWKASTGEPVGEPLQHTGPVVFTTFSPDGKTLLTAELPPDESATARLWDARTGKPLRKPIAYVPALLWPPFLFSADSRLLLSGSRGGVRVWDVATGAPCGEPLPGPHQVDSLALSPDGAILAVAGLQPARPNDPGAAERRGHVLFWDLVERRLIAPPIRVNAHANPRVLFSPDGALLLVLAGFEAHLWDVPRPVAGGAEHARLWLEASTGLELDAGGAVVSLEAKAWGERWKRLQKLGGPPMK